MATRKAPQPVPNSSRADAQTRSDSCPQLLTLAVHELRSPASVVSGYLRMLQRDTEAPLTERHRRLIDEAEKSCARLVALIAELGELSKLDAGLTTLGQEPLDLFPLIQQAAKVMHEAADRGVRLEVRGAKAGASMIGDPARLRGAFTAIFRAILREQPAACTVVAECRLERSDQSSSAVIVVAADEHLQSAYESTAAPFDEKRGGLGVALPIARRVIEGHGGRVWAPQNAQDRGAAVVFLPLSQLKR